MEQFSISVTSLQKETKTSVNEKMKEAEVGFKAEQERANSNFQEEQQRVTILVDTLERKISSLDTGHMVKTMEAISQQDERDDARSKVLLDMFKRETNALYDKVKEVKDTIEEVKKTEVSQEGRLKEEFKSVWAAITSLPETVQSSTRTGGNAGGGRAPRLKLPDPNGWKIDVLKGEHNFS